MAKSEFVVMVDDVMSCMVTCLVVYACVCMSDGYMNEEIVCALPWNWPESNGAIEIFLG